MSNYSHTEKEAFKQLNSWILDSVEEFSKIYEHVEKGFEHLLAQLSKNNSESVEFDAKSDSIIYCLNQKSEWITASGLFPASSTLDILDREEDWDDIPRESRGAPTCYPLHNMEEFCLLYPIFRKRKRALNPLDISQLQFNIDIVREADFLFPANSEYTVILSKLMEVEHWLMKQPLIPDEFSMYADNNTIYHTECRIYVTRPYYYEMFDLKENEEVYNLGRFSLSDLHKGVLSKESFNETLVPTEGYLDSLFMHWVLSLTRGSLADLELADRICVEVENRMVWKSKMHE